MRTFVFAVALFVLEAHAGLNFDAGHKFRDTNNAVKKVESTITVKTYVAKAHAAAEAAAEAHSRLASAQLRLEEVHKQIPNMVKHLEQQKLQEETWGLSNGEADIGATSLVQNGDRTSLQWANKEVEKLQEEADAANKQVAEAKKNVEETMGQADSFFKVAEDSLELLRKQSEGQVRERDLEWAHKETDRLKVAQDKMLKLRQEVGGEVSVSAEGKQASVADSSIQAIEGKLESSKLRLDKALSKKNELESNLEKVQEAHKQKKTQIENAAGKTGKTSSLLEQKATLKEKKHALEEKKRLLAEKKFQQEVEKALVEAEARDRAREDKEATSLLEQPTGPIRQASYQNELKFRQTKSEMTTSIKQAAYKKKDRDMREKVSANIQDAINREIQMQIARQKRSGVEASLKAQELAASFMQVSEAAKEGADENLSSHLNSEQGKALKKKLGLSGVDGRSIVAMMPQMEKIEGGDQIKEQVQLSLQSMMPLPPSAEDDDY